jgi:isoleucyl-tRNA synthetase
MTPRNDEKAADSGRTFQRIPPTVHFPALEREILALWREIDAFPESVRRRPADREYVFYDGPPFPTGSPHYGNLLAGVIKDMVPRYWTMRGYRVERRFGWDTHGLPIEMEVEKRLGISGPRQISEYGIDRFNAAAREVVQANTENWEALTERIGRWVDFENDYKTLDPEYMESVWWVFKQLWDKGLVYKDFKVLPYSWGAATPLSNFEANNDYRDVDDPSIVVRLEVIDGGPREKVDTGDYLLIWTTTPWTLPGNLAVAVGADHDYTKIEHDGGRYWMASARVSSVFDDAPKALANATGSEMIGARYQPPFDFFSDQVANGAFRVIGSDQVTVDEGTGLVHMAPAYGETDFYALRDAGITALVDPVDAEGDFTDRIPPVAGMNIKEADSVLIGLLRDSGALVSSTRITHSYPFCERTGTPLIYKAIPTWFVAVETFKDRMVEINDTIHWVPEYVGSRRFGNWLENARDWAISRNRYWGSCIPVWECDSCAERTAIGSVDELEALSGQRPDDLHKHIIDDITWACAECDGTMTRVPEVLDGWFESGSMPYGMLHYPFENKARFEAAFPAKFIAEGIDQTRGWFYTLIVLSTALFDKPAFENCVVNGHILADDGRKMSKSLKNYPDPSGAFDTYGADALRAFLINSPVLRAEPLRFTMDGVAEVVRTVLLPMWNSYSFFTTYAEADGVTIEDLHAAPAPEDRPEIDRWILSVLQSLVSDVNLQMEGYYLYNVVPPTLGFIDHLTNWYIRRSRRRFWRARGESGEEDTDKLAAFATLYEVITTFTEVLAPVLPFITEHLYQDLVARHDPSAVRSVHHRDFPEADSSVIDADLEREMAVVREAVGLGRTLRKREGHRVRQPLATLTVLSRDPMVARAIETHQDIIAEELNVKRVVTSLGDDDLVVLSAKANYRRLGPVLGSRMDEVASAIAALGPESLESVLSGGSVEVGGHLVTADDLVIERSPVDGTVVETGSDMAIALDTTLTETLRKEGLAREVISRVQRMRRDADLEVTDRITLSWETDSPDLIAAIEDHQAEIAREVLAVMITRASATGQTTSEIDGRMLALRVTST